MLDWRKCIKNPEEKPLESIPAGGGFTGIFRSIGCVGDSLSSGEFEAHNEKGDTIYYDAFDYSWGQFLARFAGTTVRNFSRGGMSAKEYVESFAAANGFWNPDLKCQAYIFALGVNDLYNFGQEVGSTADICREDYSKNKKTFAGYYAEIMQRLLEIEPRARFFLMTMPKETKVDERRERLGNEHRALLYDLAKFFPHTYVLDIRTYAPVYDEEFKKTFFMGGHMNPMGYAFTAKMVASYIDYIVRQNPEEFKGVGLIGTSLHNKTVQD